MPEPENGCERGDLTQSIGRKGPLPAMRRFAEARAGERWSGEGGAGPVSPVGRCSSFKSLRGSRVSVRRRVAGARICGGEREKGWKKRAGPY